MVLTYGFMGFPRSVILLDWAGNIVFLTGTGILFRIIRESVHRSVVTGGDTKRMLIVGAGGAGAALCEQALTAQGFQFKPVVFVDENGARGTSIAGIPVAGGLEDVERVAASYKVEMIVVAEPPNPAQMRELVELCQRTDMPLKVLPATADILDGKVSISHIRPVDPVDLLGRPPAKLDRMLISDSIRNKRVLVTGAGGSVGSELARHLASLGPEKLVLIDHAENPLFMLETEFHNTEIENSLVFEVLDVTDPVTMTNLLGQYEPQVVFHAAAHKHLPLMERTPDQAVKNNVGGTYCAARCSISAGVEKFVLVSTDKAANQTSVMGATKRLAELVIQEMNTLDKTRFTSVRFGNVIGSNASVVPIFKKQIENGGPVTVTHPEVRRYFMSISEAAGLIMQAAALSDGGETFVLDMGEPVMILKLAETLISLSGLKPHEDIGVVFTGLRAGEKLTEVLYAENERLLSTGYEKLLRVEHEGPDRSIISEVETLLEELPTLRQDDVKTRLGVLVPEYRPSRSGDQGERKVLHN